MLQSDAKRDDDVLINSNIDSINLEAISEIEKELDPYDLVSVVFLLYNSPDVALERLIVFQRLSRDRGEKDLKILYDWAQQAQTRRTWKQEFLEALAVCQVYNVIRKLGFRVSIIKKHYLPNDLQFNFRINPMKKVLYKLCESVTSGTLEKIQNTLKTYDIDTTEHAQCELIFLELICKKFIIIESTDRGRKFQIEKLAKIVENFPGLKKFAADLRAVQAKCNNEINVSAHAVPRSSSSESEEDPKEDTADKLTANAFEELYQYVNEMNLDEQMTKSLASDTKKSDDGIYTIKNSKRVGVCYIINQEEFHPSKSSIESRFSSADLLGRRLGSDKDKKKLETTMTSLNFEVISHRNLDSKKMMEYIKSIVQYRVHPDDSIFMLCILSHGVRGHVYAADSVLVKLDDIQKLLDDGFEERQLNELPKVLILQACQSTNDEPPPAIVADSPSKFYMRKSNFLIYWATAPELEAYRIEKEGSIFIQMLCLMIEKYAALEHLYDIFTKVTDIVAKICTKLQKDQIPIFESTLRKKIYLKMPA